MRKRNTVSPRRFAASPSAAMTATMPGGTCSAAEYVARMRGVSCNGTNERACSACAWL
jgi:hypothetical protein